MKKTMLSALGLVLCAGMLFAFNGKAHKAAKRVVSNCDTVYIPTSSIKCNNGFTVYGFSTTTGPGYAYPNCACQTHGGPYPLGGL